jgi:hypothetical protein
MHQEENRSRSASVNSPAAGRQWLVGACRIARVCSKYTLKARADVLTLTAMKKLLRIARYGAAAVAALYVLLLIPESERTVPLPAPSQQVRPFFWNQDAYWDSLEKRFVDARHKGCDLITILVQGAFQQWTYRLEALDRESFRPQAPIFGEIEQLTFQLGPWIGACPQYLSDYITLWSETRRLVKNQSNRWDLNDRQSRETIYRLLYGGRMAVEEVILQSGPEHQPPDLLQCSSEPSATPRALLLGVEIRSGDILVSRGGAPTSALIARGNDFPGNFSHIALAHVDPETGLLRIIESHIEKGVAVATPEEYIRDTKLRVMVLRLRSDLQAMVKDPMLPHKAATIALDRAAAGHIPYDFSMNYRSDDKLFCSEVASFAYRKAGIDLWMGLSHLTSPGLRNWLSDFGVEHFETQEPSDLEYDPQVRVVAEWRNTEILRKDHYDNAVTEVMLERAEQGERLAYSWYMLPIARIAKAYSVILNWFGAVGPVPEGMSATSALKHDWYARRHEAIKEGVIRKAEAFRTERGYWPPYWWLLRFARESR